MTRMISWMVMMVVTIGDTEMHDLNISKHDCLQIHLVLACTINPSQLLVVLGIHWVVEVTGKAGVLEQEENQVEGCK